MKIADRCVVVGSILAAAGALGASTAFAQGAQRYPLVGPEAILYCEDLTPFPGEIASQPVEGFALFNVDDEADMLSVVVALKGSAPDTSYQVRLLQTGGGDCHTFDGVLTTNGRGNGTLQLIEPDVGTGAQVIVDTGWPYGTPSYRATEVYGTE